MMALKMIKTVSCGLIVIMLLTAIPIGSLAADSPAEVKHTFDFGIEAANKPVGIKVYNPGKNDTFDSGIIGDATADNNITDIFKYIGEGVTDANGEITVSFVTGTDSGWYTIVATPESGAARETKRVAYISPTSFNKAVASLRGASGTGETARGFFNIPANEDLIPTYVILGLDTTDAYNDVFTAALCTDSIKDEIYKAYEKKGVSISSDAATIPTEVKALFEEAVYEEVLFNLKDEAGLRQFIKDYDEKLGLDELPVYKNVYSGTAEYSDLIDGMLKALASHQWTAEEKADMENNLQEILFINAFQSAALYDKKAKIINDSKDFLLSVNADIDGFSNASGEDVCRQLSEVFKDAQPKDIEEFVSELNGIVSPTTGGGSSSSKPSNSGGGRGNSSSVSIGGGAATIVPPKEVEQLPFTDLENCPWAHEALTELAKAGIVEGKENEKFFPDDKITREEFVKLVVLAFDMFNKEALTELQDVRVTAWYYPYVASAAENGIVTGYNNKFGTGEYISRQDMAVILMRVLELKSVTLMPEKSVEFSDENHIADYAKSAVQTFADAGIINGMGDGTFAPASTATRGQAAKIIYEVRRKING